MSEFEESYAKLNDEQKAAVDHIDGPLIVIAGPGTGKTQLLSVRAANILRNRDVSPQNILCLTYTEAGARAMSKRLIELIGRDGYGIEVSTFHAFASACRSRYPEYFAGGLKTGVVSSLHSTEILDDLLKELPYGSPLAAIYMGVAANIDAVSKFISNIKKQGLTAAQYRAIMEQNLATADYLESTNLMDYFSVGVPSKKDEKQEFIERFETDLEFALTHAPHDLTQNVIGTSGAYVPYITWLLERANSTTFLEGNSAKGFTTLRDDITSKVEDTGTRVYKVRTVSEKGKVAADIYEKYQARLEKENLQDFDDMISEFVNTVRTNDQLRFKLQEQYQYIQVDEFQDTNAAQMAIVELLSDGIENPNVMAVGDDDQAIMRFQGASIACIGQFRSRFNPASIVLKTNYRSTPEIVKLGQELGIQIENRLPESVTDKEIKADRKSGTQLTFTEKVYKTQELEYAAVVRDIRKHIDEGFVEAAKKPDEAIAVIANAHKYLTALIPYLREENIPFSYVLTKELFLMESMQTTLALLRFVAANASGSRALAESYIPQIIASAEFGGTSESSINFALFAKQHHHGKWFEALAHTTDARLQAIYADLLDWSVQATTAPVRELIFKMTQRCRAYYAAQAADNPLAFAEYQGGIKALINFVQDELTVAGALNRPMRIADVVDRLDRAQNYGVKIEASISVGTPGAVQLTTAHSSKGLEFDLVYLLDAEQGAWHKSGGGGVNLYTPNVLIDDKKDDDDIRRLLFVAATRAKDYLEICRGDGKTICELAESIDTCEVDLDVTDLALALETSWRDSYVFDTPELKDLLVNHLPPRSISASALNLFVGYSEEEGRGAERYPAEKILRLPEAPQIFFEYGTEVHAYLEHFVNDVLKNGGADVEELAAHYRAQIEGLDYRPEDIRQYAQRFDRVVRDMTPWLVEHVGNYRLETEVSLSALAGDDVPLFGFCDLLLVDDEAKTVHVADYKTGFHYPDKEPDRAYQRQLQFYRLLIENSAEYAGYHVETCENWYVEPDKKTGCMHEPVVSSVNDEDIEYLTNLLNAVWHRIVKGEFDSSAFEDSQLKADALSNLPAPTAKGYKTKRETALQVAYEQWLIDSDLAILA